MPPFGFTETGEPGRPAPLIVADVPPTALHDRVDAPPAQTGEAEAVKELMTGAWMTVTVTSLVTVPQGPFTVRR